MVLGIRFRTRAQQRDQQGDRARMQSVRDAVLAARNSAEREREGLRLRIAEWYDRAVAIMDTSGEYGTRSPEDESEISAASKEAAAAELRVREIARSVAVFDDILGKLDEAEQAAGQAADAPEPGGQG
ncbi:hypothetical protein [Devosia sp. Root635]|uniref:hypothetical protein n=1 Tax=Devosia sp. Root635 TaxID=1736575 RepID=UPI0012E3334D|nr:hypothetical protein [Devosia sp. Root635]